MYYLIIALIFYYYSASLGVMQLITSIYRTNGGLETIKSARLIFKERIKELKIVSISDDIDLIEDIDDNYKVIKHSPVINNYDCFYLANLNKIYITAECVKQYTTKELKALLTWQYYHYYTGIQQEALLDFIAALMSWIKADRYACCYNGVFYVLVVILKREYNLYCNELALTRKKSFMNKLFTSMLIFNTCFLVLVPRVLLLITYMFFNPIKAFK